MRVLFAFLAAFCATITQADTAMPAPVEMESHEKKEREELHERLMRGNEQWILNGYDVKQLNEETYHTPNMVAGLMFFITAITIFFCGCCCLSSVTTPKEFADKPLTIAKEW